MADEFKPGDLVILRSGGPVMTVKAVGDYQLMPNGVLCNWFEGSKRHEELFTRESIKKYSDHD